MTYRDTINPEKWYSVGDLHVNLEWSEDTIRRWILRGELPAFIQSNEDEKGRRRKRVYRSVKVLGADVIRFIERKMGRK